MLIPMDELVAEHDVRPTGVLHLGAHLAEERPAYVAAGVRDIWWVEGNPELVDTLRRVAFNSWDKERHVTDAIICAILGEHDAGDLTLHVANNGESSSVLPLGTHATEHPEVVYTGQTYTARSTSVDTLVLTRGIDADFLNLDLQGYELPVLRGAIRYLTRWPRWVYCEVNQAELYRGCALVDEIDEWLAAFGFERTAETWTRHGWGDALYTRRDQ